jgi:hypothetical protein
MITPNILLYFSWAKVINIRTPRNKSHLQRPSRLKRAISLGSATLTISTTSEEYPRQEGNKHSLYLTPIPYLIIIKFNNLTPP